MPGNVCGCRPLVRVLMTLEQNACQRNASTRHVNSGLIILNSGGYDFVAPGRDGEMIAALQICNCQDTFFLDVPRLGIKSQNPAVRKRRTCPSIFFATTDTTILLGQVANLQLDSSE